MSTLPSGLSAIVGADETVARFLTSSSWFAASKRRIKHQAFLPAPDNDTSTFRNQTLGPTDLWTIADAEFRDRPVTIHGAAIAKVSVIRENTLDSVAHEPPDFHANIRGWPIGLDPELQKAKRKDIATAISETAMFLPRQ